jgi:mono/diheme cytochrome c family protein
MHFKSGRPANAFAALSALALVVLSAFALSACGGATAADTWLQPNQNSFNTRYTGGRISTGTINTVAVGWTADISTPAGNGEGAPSPYITNRTVFIRNRAGRVEAIDLASGQPRPGLTFKVNAVRRAAGLGRLSRASILRLSPRISPVLTAGEDETPIVVGAAGGRVGAIEVKTRQKAWSTQLKASQDNTTPSVIANMAAAHGTIYVPVANVPTKIAQRGLDAVVAQVTSSKKNNGQLIALDASSGKVSWTKKLASVPLGAATVVNDIVFTSTLDGHVYGFNAGNGDQVFESVLPAGAVAPLAAYSGTLIVPAGFVSKRGQKAQVVAFTIGGMGVIGGAAPPKIKQQAEQQTAAQATGEKSGGGAAAGPDGAALFTANCAGCHTLKAANASGTSGPNLDQLKPSEAVVKKQVTNGGAVMPPFKGTLSPAEIAALAKYVSSVAGK